MNDEMMNAGVQRSAAVPVTIVSAVSETIWRNITMTPTSYVAPPSMLPFTEQAPTLAEQRDCVSG
jgi:hypothetical protein